METIHDLLVLVEKSRERVTAEQKRMEGYYAQVRAAVISGQSSGDPVLDYSIATRGEPDSRILKPCYGLNRALKGKAGQQILLPYSKKVRVRYGIVGGEDEYRTYNYFNLSVLTGDQIVFENKPGGDAMVPSESYAESEKRLDVTIGPLWKLSRTFHSDIEYEELVIGDEAVQKWLSANFISDDKVVATIQSEVKYARLLEKLGRLNFAHQDS